MYRSTKGASKARRDQINSEIRNLRELLPICASDKSRLSYLHIMSLACIYTRKSVFFGPEAALEGALPLISSPELADFLKSLPGFLIALNSEGKLIYVSENVSEHLGHSMVDLVAQGDSIYDITDSLDHLVLSSNLMFSSLSEPERLFRCHFNTSRSVRRQSAGNKLVLIRGRYHQPPPGAYWSSKPVFIAFCTPLDTRPRLFDNHLFLGFFESQHAKDMMFTELSDSVGYYLGYQKTELIGKSWYNLLHPQDLPHASAQHSRFLSGGNEARVEMVVRLQCKDALWTWVYMVTQVESAEVPMLCYNYIVSESEAWCLRQQLIDEQEDPLLFPYTLPPHWETVQSPSYLSSPDTVFTPMASTPTSGVSAQSFDFSGICGLDFAEAPASAAREEDNQLLNRGGLPPLPPQEKQESGPRESDRAGKLPELSYSDCMFVNNSPTPPCTPQLLGHTFLFGGPEPFGQTSATGIYYPLEPCASLYERLPPSPDSPGGGGCTVMGLPQVPTPLYIHVPSTPEGLLTPEASPIKLPAGSYFGYLEGMERTQLDALAKRLGCHLVDTREACSDAEHGDPQPADTKDVCEVRSSSLPAEAPILDFQALKQCRSVDFSMLSFGEADAEDEDAIENILKDLGAPTMEGGAPGPSCRHPCGNSDSPTNAESGAGAAYIPDACPATDLSPEEQSFLEELTSYETVFETFASRSPCDGFVNELYQLHSQGHEYFYQDGSGGNPSF
ncbi:neuronal PAS domain-containing protein 4-like [Scyliorhinus torazame]|uniref:neuronal PAS domain-containing protein 4-like n=1 Tax=Scyliorhinus torazame TaxID=75743 RepID=UPI003B5D0452